MFVIRCYTTKHLFLAQRLKPNEERQTHRGSLCRIMLHFYYIGKWGETGCLYTLYSGNINMTNIASVWTVFAERCL